MAIFMKIRDDLCIYFFFLKFSVRRTYWDRGVEIIFLFGVGVKT